MKKSNFVNEGGINGLGESLINTNSSSFKELKSLILNHYNERSEIDRMSDKILSLRFQMETYLSSDDSGEIIPAGNFIEQLIKVAGISKKRFSHYIDYDYSNLIAVLKGRRKINPDLAIKAGSIFGISPAIWLHIESKNELSVYMRSHEVVGEYSFLGLLE